MYCRHVYEEVGSDYCPDCGKWTHKVDWNRYKEERDAHREKYGWFHNVGTWWSI